MFNEYPKFEKVDDNTIKIIVEQAKKVPLYQILENKKKLLEQKKQIEQALENIENILKSAKELDITPKEKDKDIKK